jgi:hypothetical protein
MNVPTEILVIVEDAATGDPAADVILLMTIRSGTKNDYHITFPKSDSQGRARLSKADLVGQFEDHWETGLMDYNGSLDAASPVVLFELFDDERMEANREELLAWPLLRNEKKKWKSRNEVFDYMSSSSNRSFAAPKMTVELPSDGIVRFKVAKKF